MLVGGAAAAESKSEDKVEQDNDISSLPPKVLHLKLSASVLEAIVGESNNDTSVKIVNVEDVDTVSAICLFFRIIIWKEQAYEFFPCLLTSASAHQWRSAHASF